MKRKNQIRLTETLCESIKQEIISKIKSGKIPEHWDGIEIREYLTTLSKRESIFENAYRGDYSKRGKRYKDFKNTLAITPL